MKLQNYRKFQKIFKQDLKKIFKNIFLMRRTKYSVFCNSVCVISNISF